MRTRLVVALALTAAAAACKTAEVRPTGAGSTAVLRLLRDWRGVWSGPVRESPMGELAYTLYVEEKDDAIRLLSAPLREAGLDTLKHEYRLIHFVKGNPAIEFSLSQKGRTDEGRLIYREEDSGEETAVFCREDSGCDKLKFVVEMLDEKTVELKTMVDEAPHAAFKLKFVSRDVPKDHGEWLDKPVADKPKDVKPKVKVDADGNPLDQDMVLQEHKDDDAGKAPKRDGKK